MNTTRTPSTDDAPGSPGWQLSKPCPGLYEQATAVKVGAGVLAPLILTLALLGGIGSFATVRTMAGPWFGEWAWIVPVGVDIGILVLLAWDLLLEHLDMPWPVLRWVAWSYIAGTVTVNVMAAGGDMAGSLLHAAMPILFVTVIEGVRHFIRCRVGLATGTRIERIPAARWALAPLSTALLWRRMVLWHIASYQAGLDVEYQHLLAVSRLQQTYGRLAWRWRAPLPERHDLRRLPVQASIARRGTPSADEPHGRTTETGLGPPNTGDHKWTLPDWLDDDLLQAAEQVLNDANRRGLRLNRTAFGTRLRAQGFTIANERLAELRATAMTHALRPRTTCDARPPASEQAQL